MSKKTIVSMSFPTDLLRKIDRLAKAEYTTRSDYIRQTLLRSTKQQEKDEVEAAWQELIDGAEEMAALAEKAGYKTDKDFARLAKEIRQDRRNRR